MAATAPPTREPQTELERIWWELLDPRGPYDDGWWYAHCPKHDDDEPDMYGAQVNFTTRKFRCVFCTQPGKEPRDANPDKEMSLRNPTAWVQGFADSVEQRKADAEANKQKRLERQAERKAEFEKRRAERKAAREADGEKWVEARKAIARLKETFPGAPEEFFPGRHFAEFCEPLVIAPIKEPVNGDDGWWMGWCPIHDHERKRENPTAMYHFRLGSYKCLAEIPCHAPKRGLSIINLRKRLVEAARG